MGQLQGTKARRRIGILALLGAVASALHAPLALGVEATTEQGASLSCAVLEDFVGDVQIIDASRTHLIGTHRKTGVPCGGWVSSATGGWARLRHRDGYRLLLGSNTFIEIPESNSDGKDSGDHAVLYRGEVHVQTVGGTKEFKLITANGRVRASRGSFLVLFNQEEQETQLIALSRSAQLENRFEKPRKVVVKAGEASSMNFRLQRTIPSTARAVSATMLKTRLADLRLDRVEEKQAVDRSLQRQERKLASTLAEPEDESAVSDPDLRKSVPLAQQLPPIDRVYEETVLRENDSFFKNPPAKPAREIARRPAGAEGGSPASAEPGSYERHHRDHADDELHQAWVQKMLGGTSLSEKALFPDQDYGSPKKGKVRVRETESGGRHAERVPGSVEEKEKRRLIDELSKISEE